MLIGSRIKEARKQKGLSQQELGDLLDVSKVSICGYELGTRTPTLENFVDLLRILDITPEYALGQDIQVVSDQEEAYQVRLAKEDITIIEELKKHRELYNRLCQEPKRTVELLARRMDKTS